uniref:Fibroblast activation protein, alpha n=1 Tax=Cyprinus carpio TaxID=7962 RepID=A0A8C2PY77_CYPCA
MGCNKVCVALVGALVVITLIAIPTAIYVNRDESAFKRTYSFNDFYNDTIRYKTYSLHWISDNEYLHKTSEGHIYLHNVETKESSMYLSNSTFAQVDATDYILSGDKRFVVFESNYSKVWRHSFTASYHMYNMESREFLSKVQIPPVTQLLVWAPVENKLAYVWNYNIYLKKNATAEAVQVTHNGKVNKILNGVPDWVYEEEVFASNEAIWWSPQGKYLAYLQINDTGVHNIEYSLYGNDQYPTTVFIPYPKAGCVIPRARLFVIDVENPSRQSEVLVPKSVGVGDHYLRTVTWVTDERLAVQWLPRRQDSVLLQIYDYDGTNWKETSVRINNYMPLNLHSNFFSHSNIFFLHTMEVNGYQQLFGYNMSKGQNGKATPITSGKWEVIYISKVTKDSIYYVSNEHMGRPGQRNLYNIKYHYLPSSCFEPLCCYFFSETQNITLIMKRLSCSQSYGGYVTSMVLGSGSGLFKCGIAVAPVAKWDYYEIYASAKNFKSVQYMLVHGTADDNVHFQQAAQISKALVENQVDFEAMWYTDKDHGLSGKARYHLYAHLNHFLQNCFAEKK